jgi:hypothetical protein
MRCSDYTHIDMQALGCAEAVDGFFLQKPEQVRLHFEREIGNFIEKNGAAARRFNRAVFL